MTRHFLISASADHVANGVTGGFAQAGHGRKDFISKPAKGDWVVYYSPKDTFENGKPLQKFTAIGRITDDEPYQPAPDVHFKPFRRAVKYQESKTTEIRPLIERLSFIKNKKRWGFYLISGFREISTDDFKVINDAMR